MGQTNKICTKGLSLKIPEKLHTQLGAEADRQGISMASIVKIILTKYFEDKDSDKKNE